MLTLTEGQELASKLRNSLWVLQTEITRLGRLVNDPADPQAEIQYHLGEIAEISGKIQKLAQPLTETPLKKERKRNGHASRKNGSGAGRSDP
jgi:hypothetical protein